MNKKNITYEKYDVLDKTLNYNVQRIENDIRSIDQSGKFMIITDEGRVPMMTRTTRKMQKYNYIPSKFNPQPYKSEIQKLCGEISSVRLSTFLSLLSSSISLSSC